MPAKSKAQQKLFAIAEHDPSKVSKKNRAILKLKKSTLREFAKTKTKGLPKRIKR